MAAEVQLARCNVLVAQSIAFLRNFTSPHTRRAYRRDIQEFVSYWQERGTTFEHPADIGLDHFIAYRDFVIGQGYRSGTVCRKLIPIRSMLSFCQQLGIVDRNPLEIAKLPRADPERPTPAYSDEQVRAVLALPKRNKPIGRMHYAMLAVLFYVGVRRSELVNLKVKDIGHDKHHRTLTIRHGKGGKTRVVPLHPVVQTAIDEYLAGVGRELGPDDPLFSTVKHARAYATPKPLCTTSVYSMVKHYVKKAGIAVPGMPHACRATVISHLLDGRASIHDVAQMVGHSNVATTTMYDRRRKALDRSAAYGVNYG